MIIEIYNKVKNTYDVIYNIIIYSHILQLYSMYMNIEYIYIYTYIIKHGIDMKYKDKTSYKMNIKHIIKILIFATFQ